MHEMRKLGKYRTKGGSIALEKSKTRDNFRTKTGEVGSILPTGVGMSYSLRVGPKHGTNCTVVL